MVFGRLVGQNLFHRLDLLAHLFEPHRLCGAVIRDFLGVPAAADAEQGTRARDLIDGSDKLSRLDRVALDDEANAGINLEPLCSGRGQCHEWNFAVSAGKGCGLFRRLRRKQGGGARHGLDYALHDRRSNWDNMATLIVFSGLPASGKSSIARALVQKTGAIWLRIDSIEQAIRDSGAVPGSLDDAGYRAAYAVAEDNLRLGHDVIGDSVNPWMLTRNAWRTVGMRAGARVVEVEAVCSEQDEHRRRVESRANEVPGLRLPDWKAVISRDYHVWNRDHVTVDTAKRDVAACVELILAAISASPSV
jgi:predicted kinase